MSPRPYRLGQRQVAADETRSRILNAARAQLETEASFSIDAVARRADVARMTVYYQFGSRRGLLEALIDDLANLLFVLSSFESFDMLAGSDRTPDEVVPMVKQAAAAILRRSR